MLKCRASSDRPTSRDDFALGKEVVSTRTAARDAPTYAAGRPRVVVRDKFTVAEPKKVYRSNSGEFDLQIFDKFYRVLDAKTGELVLERAGTIRTFRRAAGLFRRLLRAKLVWRLSTSLLTERLFEGGAVLMGWGHGDTLLIPGSYSELGHSIVTGPNCRQSIVDGKKSSPRLRYV